MKFLLTDSGVKNPSIHAALLDVPDCAENSTAAAEKWAAEIGIPAYATDDQTAIKVVDGVAEVVSEGHWLCLNGAA